MRVLVELIVFSEDPKLEKFLLNSTNELTGYKIEFEKKGNERKNYKHETLRVAKNTTLHIISDNLDYNQSICELLNLRKKILNAVDTSNPDDFYSYINVSYFVDDMLSIELGDKEIALLAEQKLGLPISVYLNENGN